MKEHARKLILTSILTVFPMFVGLILWDKMPDTVVTHWGKDNVANGWSSKPFAVLGLPLLLLAVHIFTLTVTLNDPKKQNIGNKMLAFVFWLIPALSWVCCLMTYASAAGLELNIALTANMLMGIVFIVMGNYMPKSKQSYTVGIKLPWTLDSEENWSRTSRLAGKLWIAAGLIFIVNAFVGTASIVYIIIPALVIIPAGYSFILFKKGV